MEQTRDAMDLYNEIDDSASKIRAVADLIGVAGGGGNVADDTLPYASLIIEEQARRIESDVRNLYSLAFTKSVKHAEA